MMGLYWFIYQNELITDSPIMLKLYDKDNFWLITINEIPKKHKTSLHVVLIFS